MERKPEWLKVRYNQEAVREVAEMMQGSISIRCAKRRTARIWGMLPQAHGYFYDFGQHLHA